MADSRDRRDDQPPDEAALSARFRRLGKRLDRTAADRQSETEPAARSRSDPSAIARGFRLSTELVGGVALGAALGWLLDRSIGTTPWGMIVFLLLGFVAGVLNLMRSAGVIPRRGVGKSGP